MEYRNNYQIKEPDHLIQDLQNAYQNLFNHFMISNDMLSQEDNESDILPLLLGFAQLVVYFDAAVISLWDNQTYRIASSMNLNEENINFFDDEANFDYYNWAREQVRAIVLPDEEEESCHIIVPIMTKNSYFGVLHLLANVIAEDLPKQDLDILWLITSNVANRIESIRFGKRSELVETLLSLLEKFKSQQSLEDLLVSILNGVNNLMGVEAGLVIKLNKQMILKPSTKKVENLHFYKLYSEGKKCPLIESAINDNEVKYITEENYKNYSCKDSDCGFLQTDNLLLVPLEKNNKVYGVLNVLDSRYNDQLNTSEARHIIELFANQVSMAINQFLLVQELQFQTEQAKTFNKAKSDFLASMSHEIRTPLTTVIGYADVLKLELFGKLNPKQMESVNDIKNSGEHLLNIINDILDISKIEVGKMTLNYEKVNHKKIIKEVINLVKPLSSNKKINVSFDLKDNLVTVPADPVRFKQILFNLLSNAIKFTPLNGQVALMTSISESGENLVVSVIDNGIGIAQKDYDKVFAKFEQINDSYTKKQQGTGLGLSLTKQLVELHKGKIWFTSEEGEGTIFTFTLPAERKDLTELD